MNFPDANRASSIAIVRKEIRRLCGFAGFLQESRSTFGDAGAIAEAMGRTLSHRGPDDAGVWCDNESGIALAHRRLAVIDLSPAGHQPMFSPDRRYVIAFNGEIYNHLALRKELGDLPWRGHSDTETLLACFDAWGVETTLQRAVGMFAFALWDRTSRALFLARDRMGEKPLYYGWQGAVFVFGSELKALKAHPAFDGEIDREALTLFLRYNYIPTPYSIYKGISKLSPGSYLTLHPGRRDVARNVYWSARTVAEVGRREPFGGDEREARDELERCLRDSIAGQMLADVPLGAFLSGGIDSSTVVALMQTQSSQRVKTFTVGFHEQNYNEADRAKAVAQHLGCEHTELYVAPQEALAVIPKLPTLYDEPFGDVSQIPTFLISKLARRHVTVSLSGDGGDELFGGYSRYVWAPRLWRWLRNVRAPLRATLAGALTRLPPAAWDRVFHATSWLLPSGWQYANAGDKLHKLAEIMASSAPEQIYLGLVSSWKRPVDVVVNGNEPFTALTEDGRWAGLPDFTQRMMLLDTITYLPDDILTKLDRAAMSVSLETRVPMLDHRLVEFAWRLPLSFKIRNGQGKWLLRQVLHKYVPRNLIERPKTGFGVPIDAWLRGPLREWAESLLGQSRLQHDGFFNAALIRQKWAEHLSGKRSWQYQLWSVLMFQAWLGEQG